MAICTILTYTGGVLYLTNNHRLFDNTNRRSAKGEVFEWMGPAVAKATALDTGALLRDRITSHPRVMVLNDEAHHVWDPDSAWNEAITYLHTTLRQRGGMLVSQLDFSATPKDNKANYFKHIICDTPLGEAVDAGIVKTPIIGRAGQLQIQVTGDASHRYEAHLRLGYQRWLKSREEWLASGKKPLLFIMCNDTKEADEITRRLQEDSVFKELNGRTINLHTNLKGKIKKVGKGKDAREEFQPSDKDITDEDLKALRKLSRELDSGASPYFRYSETASSAARLSRSGRPASKLSGTIICAAGAFSSSNPCPANKGKSRAYFSPSIKSSKAGAQALTSCENSEPLKRWNTPSSTNTYSQAAALLHSIAARAFKGTSLSTCPLVSTR